MFATLPVLVGLGNINTKYCCVRSVIVSILKLFVLNMCERAAQSVRFYMPFVVMK